MPSKSAKQHRFMEMVAHNPKMAKKVGVPQSVGKDFETADKGKKFNKGGIMKKHDDEAQDKKLISKMIKASEKKEPKGMKKGGSVKPSKMGSVKTSPARDGVAERGHTKGRVC